MINELNSKPDHTWMNEKLNQYGCFFNDHAVSQFLELVQKMDLRTGEVQHGIKCYLKNKVIDNAAIMELEAIFKAWRYIQEHPPH